MSTSSIVVQGLLNPDGTITLETIPELSPGPVKVTVEPLTTKAGPSPRLPDEPFEDQSIPAPFDLTRPENLQRVVPKQVAERLPDPM